MDDAVKSGTVAVRYRTGAKPRKLPARSPSSLTFEPYRDPAIEAVMRCRSFDKPMLFLPFRI